MLKKDKNKIDDIKKKIKPAKRMSQKELEVAEHMSVSIFFLSERGDEALGLKLIVECIHATFLGVLQQIIHLPNRIDFWLEQPSVLATGQKLGGRIKVNQFDVVDIQIIGVDIEVRERILMSLHNSLKVHPMLMKRVVPIDEACPETVISFKNFLKDIHSNIKSSNCHFLDCVILDSSKGEDFDKAMRHIENEPIIGICYEGCEMGRFGKLAWLSISTSKCIFLLDVASLKMKICLKRGLRAIFESEIQIKVMNDSRCLEDYLCHCHECSMLNVFDIQASFVYMHMSKNEGKVPLLVSCLSYLLHDYLEHPRNFSSKYLTQVKDESLWFERPLSNALTNRLMYSAMFLKVLREKMISEMLTELKKITSIFKSCQATKEDSFVNEYNLSIVPFELQQLDPSIGDQPGIVYTRPISDKSNQKIQYVRKKKNKPSSKNSSASTITTIEE